MKSSNAVDRNREFLDVPNLGSSLCANCANLSDCKAWQSNQGSIIECEMYECCSSPQPELVGGKKQNVPEAAETKGLHLLGLCSNCDHRRDCSLPKPSSGVWHCEMYV